MAGRSGRGENTAAQRRSALLAWYRAQARDLPWRVSPGARAAGVRADPYRVWLSEIMLQQTTVQAVKGYFDTFTARWPTVGALAAAPRDDVLAAWAGLGYYARARNLHACAEVVARDHGGRFPDTVEGLQALPGIGPYTARAVAAIAFDRPVVPMDGNVERVMARLHAVETPLPAAKPELARLADAFEGGEDPGDIAQALMDLGATVCTPRAPACVLCPLREGCAAAARGIAADLPRKAPKAAKPRRFGIAFWVTRADGAVLVRRRPDEGLLGGMVEFPSTPWGDEMPGLQAARAHAPVDAAGGWVLVPGRVAHVFTHFALELAVARPRCAAGARLPEGAFWAHPRDFGALALPTVMRKVARLALDEAG
ncbi:A/G-specific adenine glycosylase [Futiania mangrovi]|uniref:Adenine DNA glycosylase n=1 Tax=Futiania mangrovi TaxID=2959716 RepID=A0A9J6PGI3_9PROT|nr:A/G-specific adenine glycosylase [Futiania mangrovii]MCP1337582.1 A/G-specific adenine glycosylase [Futiania mangrovii]